MGRSVSYPTHATWVLYTHLDQGDRQVFVCRKCDHQHYELESEPDECAECGNVGFTSYPECDAEFEWECFMDSLTSAFKQAFPSLKDCDKWLDREDHAVLENSHAWVGVSEYCGLVSVWCVPKECEDIRYNKAGYRYWGNEDGLRAQWAMSVEAKAKRVLEGFAERLEPISLWVFEAVKHEPERKAALPCSLPRKWCLTGCAKLVVRRREGMAFMLAALDGSGGISPLCALPFRPLIRRREPSGWRLLCQSN